MRLQVAVVGGGVGGMTAAGVLAAKGHRVTLFEQSARLGGKCGAVLKDGFALDTGPTLLTMPKTVSETFQQLRAADLMPQLTALDVQCDYRWAEGQRLQAVSSLETMQVQAERLGEGEGEALGRYYETARRIWEGAGAPYLDEPYEGFFAFMKRMMRHGPSARQGMRLGSLASLARRYFGSAALRQFVGRFATYAGASPFQASATFALISHLERAEGVFHPKGGMGAVAGALEAALRRLNVQVVPNVKARWEFDGQVHRVGPAGDEAPFDAVVVNADPLASLGRQDEPLSMSGYVLLLRAGKRLALPHHAISFARDEKEEFEALFSGKLPAHPTVYVCHPAKTDPTAAPEGKSGLFVMLNAPVLRSGEERLPWRDAEQARALCLARLRSDFPELRAVALDVLEERTPVDLAAMGAPLGSIYGYLPHGLLGTFRRPAIRGRTPGVYFAGGGTHPGGGVPMVMLSGRFAAELLEREVVPRC